MQAFDAAMTLEFFTISLLNGLSYGLLLFMLSAGLTLIFSMMGVLNFAHASFYMVGAYVAYSLSQVMGFWWSLLAAPLVVFALGAAFERFCLRRVHQFGHVPELLVTFGLSYLLLEVVQLVWGRAAVNYALPGELQGPLFTVFGTHFPKSRAFIMAISLVMLAGIWLLLHAHAHRAGDPGGADAPGNGAGAGPQRAARLHAGVRRRRGAGRAGRRGRRQHLCHRARHGRLGRRDHLRGGRGRRAGFAQRGFSGVDADRADPDLRGRHGPVADDAAGALQTSPSTPDTFGYPLLRLTISQVAPILPFLLLVLMLIFRPRGLLGTREG